MSWYRKNPLFAAALTLCALLVLGELAFTYERYAAWRGAEKKLRDQTNELQGMSALTPPPTREVATAIETDLAKAQASLAAMQNELKGHGPAAERLRTAKVPAARTDAYFDLATFVEKMRELAKKNDIVVRPEAARFGFEVYKNEGPELDRIEPVFRQRQIAQYLIELLLEAKPRAILAVKRERTVTKEEKEKRAAALANNEPLPEPEALEEGPDYFAIDPDRTARVPGFVDATAFRVTFLGQTTALRAFLNRLASFELPVLVREVEVETATPEEAVGEPTTEETPVPDAPAAADAAEPASVVLSAEPAAAAPKPAAPKRRAPTAAPIVTKPLSRFTVTVEHIELVTPPPPADPNAAPAQPPSE